MSFLHSTCKKVPFESYLHDLFDVPVALNAIAETLLDSHRCFEKHMFQESTENP